MNCKVAIVILTKDHPKLLKQCLSSIIQHTSKTKCKFYIADTGSSFENMLEYKQVITTLLHRDNCVYLQLNNYHFAANNNAIIREYVKEPWVLTCNDDIELQSNCIDTMLKHAKKHRHVGTVGCRLLFPNGTVQHAGQIAYIDPAGLLQCTHRGYKSNMSYGVEPVVGNTAALMLIKRKLFLDNTGFDEIYTECWEDIQFNMRLILEGYTNWYLDDVHATHHESVSRERNERSIYRLRYDYTYKLKPWFDSLSYDKQQLILNI